MSTPEAKPCPACGSDSNERDELTKAEREIERLAALAGPSGKRLGELERINDDLIADNERLTAERDALRAKVGAWQGLYRRAINEANGLTNYVEDRSELRSAERRLDAIEAQALAALAAAHMSYENVLANFGPDRGKSPEGKAHMRAMVAASDAEREARVLLLTLKQGEHQ